METKTQLTYSSYLKIDELLSLQQPKSDPVEHDEILFIIIHQVYELWFKLILHEFEKVKLDFSSNRLWEAVATFKRIRMVLKTLVGQIDILETMTPMSFMSFRHRLDTASGFQSAQFRELEFLL
ncbi:MAG TPA: tryptophan 2,3-dioxygenase family protein, partial [Acidobacteriota bacterium]|nr:tryptophan 2,3-dioxygenase family protein [Acidobacteriota bacterium]